MTNVFFSENIQDRHPSLPMGKKTNPHHHHHHHHHHHPQLLNTLGLKPPFSNVGPPTKALLGLFKEISDATGTDAREDLHEFGGRDAEEGHACLSRSKPLGLRATGIWRKKQRFGEGNCLYWYKCICIFTIHESKLPYLMKLVFVCFS